MLTLTRDNDRFIFASDDEAGENGALQDAIEDRAPHLLASFNDTPVSDDGTLRFGFAKEDWPSCIEVCESLAMSGMIDPDAAEAMGEQVEKALDE